jgi:hypothetical protein
MRRGDSTSSILTRATPARYLTGQALFCSSEDKKRVLKNLYGGNKK